jgi:AraC family transcriptional regulator
MLEDPEKYFRPEAQLFLPGITVRVGCWMREDPYEAVFGPKDVHIICLFLTERPSTLKGCYLRDGAASDSGNVGEILFAPAGYQMYQKSTTLHHPQRTVRCEVAPDVFGDIGDLLAAPIDRRDLKACLDLHLDHTRRSMLRLAKEAAAPDIASRVLVNSLAAQVFVDAVRYLRDNQIRHYSQPTLAAWQLRRIDELLNDFSHGAPTVDQVAAEYGVSRRHINRVFKATTGRSIREHVVDVRLNRAKAMLVETKLPLKVISFQLGFSSQSSFSYAFRTLTGVSPRDFRQRLRL